MATGAEGSTPLTPAGVYGRHGLAVRCALEGRDVGAGGLSYRLCPYDGGRPFSQRAWLLGYVAGRRLADLPMPDDEDEDEPVEPGGGHG